MNDQEAKLLNELQELLENSCVLVSKLADLSPVYEIAADDVERALKSINEVVMDDVTAN